MYPPIKNGVKAKISESTSSDSSSGRLHGRTISVNLGGRKKSMNFTTVPTDELIGRKEFQEKLNQIETGTRIDDKTTLKIECDNIKGAVFYTWVSTLRHKYGSKIIFRTTNVVLIL